MSRAVLPGLVLVISISGAFPCHARSWNVNPNQTGDAPTIQAAIDSATAGDEVVLAAGTYTPTNQGTPLGAIMLRLKPGVVVRGEEGTVSAVIDAEVRECIIGRDLGPVRIANLTIRRGSGAIAAMDFSGNCMPTIENCVFQSNSGAPVGALRCESALIRDCQFIDNRSRGSGAVFCENSNIENCTFKGNRATGDGSASGGALGCRNTQIRDCVFESNVAGDFLGAQGGAISGDTVTILSSWFIDNLATAGFAGERHSAGGAASIRGVSTIAECVFIGNKAIEGGAVAGREGTTISRCTFLGNESLTSDGIGGIALDEGGAVNAVILAHTLQGQACSGSSVTWTCSNLFGNVLGDELCGIDGGNNLSVDPEFCAADPETSRNVGIQSDSPCAPGQHPEGAECDLIGAGPVACDPVAVQPASWSTVKRMFR